MSREKEKIDFPVIPSDREDDLHNLDFADSADLVLFVAGNQFMVMDELIRVFQEEYPDVKKCGLIRWFVRIEDDLVWANTRKEIVSSIQQYLADELQIEIGSFDAQFLVDFFAEQLGCYYYNQGLADALKAFEAKIEETSDIVYQLEKEPRSGKD